MKKIVRLTESDIKRMVMEVMDAWEDSIYKKNQDQGFRNRYGIGQDWPHYDNEDYDNGIWQDDDGKCWTVYPGERQATCLDDEMNESRGLGYGLSDKEKCKVRDEHNDMRKHSHYTGRGVKGKPGEKSKKTYDIFKHEGDKGNPWSKNLKKGGAADWVANMQDDDINESVGRKTIRLTESELKHLIRESVKRVLREDINTDSTNKQIYVHEDFSAGYLDKNNGNSYCCDVYRSFSTNKLHEGDITISLEDLYNICPIEIDTINDILFNRGQRLVNVYNEIYNGEKVGSEHWECGKPYGDWVEISKEPAKDKGWYEHLTHRNQMAKFRHLNR